MEEAEKTNMIYERLVAQMVTKVQEKIEIAYREYLQNCLPPKNHSVFINLDPVCREVKDSLKMPETLEKVPGFFRAYNDVVAKLKEMKNSITSEVIDLGIKKYCD